MKFYNLKIKTITKNTPSSVYITLDIPEELKQKFLFQAGQYLTLSFQQPSGEEIRRDYSICTAPYESELSIAIKAISNGNISKKMVYETKQGDILKVSTPHGNFKLNNKPNEKRTILLFAAGSGITPIISIIKNSLYVEPNINIQLFYINKTHEEVMLHEEIKELEKTYPYNFKTYNFFTKETTTNPIFYGRIDSHKMDLIKNQLIDEWDEVDKIFICGPDSMIRTIALYATNNGIPQEDIHFELFAVSNETIFEQKRLEEKSNIKEVSLKIILDGEIHNLTWYNNGENLLDFLLNQGIDAPYSCKGGVCSSCMCKTIKGEVILQENMVLTEDDIKNNLVLSCISTPKTSTLEVDFDNI